MGVLASKLNGSFPSGWIEESWESFASKDGLFNFKAYFCYAIAGHISQCCKGSKIKRALRNILYKYRNIETPSGCYSMIKEAREHMAKINFMVKQPDDFLIYLENCFCRIAVKYPDFHIAQGPRKVTLNDLLGRSQLVFSQDDIVLDYDIVEQSTHGSCAGRALVYIGRIQKNIFHYADSLTISDVGSYIISIVECMTILMEDMTPEEKSYWAAKGKSADTNLRKGNPEKSPDESVLQKIVSDIHSLIMKNKNENKNGNKYKIVNVIMIYV